MNQHASPPVVALVNCYIRHGGIEQQIRYLLESRTLQARFRPLFVYYGPRVTGAESWTGVRIVHCPWRGGHAPGYRKILTFVPFLWRLQRILRTEGAALIHTYGPFENLIGSLLSLSLRVPHVASVRTIIDWAFKFRSVWGPISGRIVSNSNEGIERLARRSPKLRKKCVLVRNGIDLSHFAFRDQNGRREPPVVEAAIIGRISPSKNQLLAVAAIGQLVRDGTMSTGDFRLRIIGPVENRNYLQQLEQEVRTRALEPFVEILPGFCDVAPIYSKSNLLLLTSRTEGLPNVVIEAMACGVSWIAADVADLRFLAGSDGERGSLFVSEDVESLEAALKWFLGASPALIQEHCRNARRFVEEELSIDQMARATADLYGEVV